MVINGVDWQVEKDWLSEDIKYTILTTVETKALRGWYYNCLEIIQHVWKRAQGLRLISSKTRIIKMRGIFYDGLADTGPSRLHINSIKL